MKNAMDYGFLPTSEPKQNAQALQHAVNGGGTISVTLPGIYDVEGSVKLEGETSLLFGAGVSIRRIMTKGETDKLEYLFVNKGAYTHTYDKNIHIKGLHIICNDVGEEGLSGEILGLRGQISFFYIKHLVLEDIQCFDLPAHSFCIHVCTFEDVRIQNIHIEGDKDGIHLGRGKRFLIRHGVFRTFDDPIALNAHDYSTSNPQLGWIEDGVIEDCYDLNDETTTGFFCRILAGSWVDWFEGMQVQHSDTVVSGDCLYRVVMEPDGAVYTSKTRPTHKKGAEELDGINWIMVQEGREYNCGCRNIIFRDIFLKKRRPVAFSIHFDYDNWSRSYYPGSNPPVQQNLIFDNITMDGEIDTFLAAYTPVDAVKILNSTLCGTIRLRSSHADNAEYGKTHILLSGNTFLEDEPKPILLCDKERKGILKIVNSLVVNDDYKAVISGDVDVLNTDVVLSRSE